MPIGGLEIDFECWNFPLDEETMIRFGSRHFDRASAGKHLLAAFAASASHHSPTVVHMSAAQVLCGNEAFPEAAVADPLADLEVWDEWTVGIRSFPYAGHFSRLGIASQEQKGTSTSSVGVLGEVLAGYFAQAGISPFILVRVIQRWPDFILRCSNGRYAFLEAKAFTSAPKGTTAGLGGRVADALLAESLTDALQQLNADALVDVWFSFAYIETVTPMKVKLTFLRVCAPPARQARQTFHVVPDAVIDGLAQRAIMLGAADVPDWQLDWLKPRLGRRSDEERQAREALRVAALVHVEHLLLEAGAPVALSSARTRLEEAIGRISGVVRLPDREEGRRLRQAKLRASTGVFERLRSVGTSEVLMADLTHNERGRVEARWAPEWTSAVRPWGSRGDVSAFRCGGALFAVADESLVGEHFSSLLGSAGDPGGAG